MAFAKRRFKFQVGNAPARPPVTRAPPKKNGERRQVLTARPSGEIVWHDWTTHEKARTNLAIEKAVATEKMWKK
jgi:hypothetical protein